MSSNYCLNCNSGLAAYYCGHCGQDARLHADPTLHDVLHETWHEFFHVDGKIFRTLKLLLVKPGALTREFFNGRRQAYVSPVRLYLTCSIVYFLVAAVMSHHEDVKVDIDTTAKIKAAQKLQPNIKNSVNEVSDDLGKALKEVSNDLKGKSLKGDIEFFGWKYNAQPYFDALRAHPEEFTHLYRSAYPKALFLLVPLFALLLQMSFLFRQRYPQYLYFSLHYHSALFVVATILLFLPGKFMILWLSAGAVYFVMATRRVWGGTKKAAIFRGAYVATFYSISFLLAMGGAGLYAILKLQ